MELWRTADPAVERPKVLCSRNLTIALALHVGTFLVFWFYAAFHGLFDKDEDVVPIDMSIVVNENLDGNEEEPPPLQEPEPEPPPPPPPPPKPVEKKIEPPKELERIVTNVVKKAEKKEEKKPEKKKEPEKNKEPEKPKKTAKEIREERMKKMRESAKTVNKSVTITVKAPSGNGRTDKKTLSDAEIRKLLNAGVPAGKTTQLAANEEQFGLSLIKAAFEAKWDQPPWTDTLKPMVIRVWFGGGGRVVRYQLEQSSGDARADQTIKSAASRVGAVPALPAAFIDKYRSSGVPIRFTVKPQ